MSGYIDRAPDGRYLREDDDPEPDGPRHGGSTPTPLEAALTPDPDLALATADMDVWLDAHPCDCHALCECDEATP